MASCPFLFVFVFVFVVTNDCTTQRFLGSSYSVDEIAMNVLMRRSDWHWHVSDNPDSFHHLSNLMSADDADPDLLDDWESNSNGAEKGMFSVRAGSLLVARTNDTDAGDSNTSNRSSSPWEPMFEVHFLCSEDSPLEFRRSFSFFCSTWRKDNASLRIWHLLLF